MRPRSAAMCAPPPPRLTGLPIKGESSNHALKSILAGRWSQDREKAKFSLLFWSNPNVQQDISPKDIPR